MTEFGIAVTFGSVVFVVTLVPAFAYFFNYGIRKPRPELTPEELRQNEGLKKLFIRDMVFIMLGLGLYYFYFDNYSINIW